MRIATILLMTMTFALPARAHLVPVDPSTCALDVSLSVAATGAAATVDPPGPGDLLRFTYEPDTSPTRSLVQACPADPADPTRRCGAAVPRGFVIGGTSGTIALPSAFGLRMLSSGDLDAQGVPITITLGGTPVAVPFTLTTGVALVGGTPVLGAPIDASGAMRLVGSGASPALPAPLGGGALLLELACVHAPAPDRDQFAPAPRLTKVRGALADKLKLVMVLESELSMAADPGGVPTVLRLDNEGATVLEVVVTLQPGPRGKFVSDGGQLTVTPLRRRGVRTQKVVLRERVGQLASLTSGEGVLALETGGLMARRAVKLTANGRGTRLAVRER